MSEILEGKSSHTPINLQIPNFGVLHAAVPLLLPFRMGSRNRLFFRAFPLKVFWKLKGRPSHFLREKPRRRGWRCFGIVYNSLIFMNVKLYIAGRGRTRLPLIHMKRVIQVHVICYDYLWGVKYVYSPLTIYIYIIIIASFFFFFFTEQ